MKTFLALSPSVPPWGTAGGELVQRFSSRGPPRGPHGQRRHSGRGPSLPT